MSGTLHRQGFQNRLLFRALPSEATGGDQWQATDSPVGVGKGITAPRTAAPAGIITGYAVEVELTQQGTSRSETRVPVMQWQFFAALDQVAADITADGLAQGRTIRSVAHPVLQFRVATIDMTLGYAVCILEVIP